MHASLRADKHCSTSQDVASMPAASITTMSDLNKTLRFAHTGRVKARIRGYKAATARHRLDTAAA